MGDKANLLCNEVNYAILAYGNPSEYPISSGSVFKRLKPGDYSSKDDTCTITESSALMRSGTTGRMSSYSLSYGSMYSYTSSGSVILSMCDCSDPENYNFADTGRFKI